jgi:hypothetical protein
MTTEDDEPGASDSPLDDLFVEGARYREPSAAERAEWAKQQRKDLEEAKKRRRREERQSQRSRPRAGSDRNDHDARTRRPLIAIALFLVLAVIAWLVFERPSNKKSGSGVRQPNHVTTYYALPQDVGVDPSLPDAIRHDIGEAQQWFAGQTNGHELRIDNSGGDVTVQTKHLDLTTDDLKAVPDAAGLVANQFRHHGNLPNTILLVFVPVNRGVECGKGSPEGVAVVWVGSCGGLVPVADGAWPAGVSTVIAHELMHALGAVPACAPHYADPGHVDTRDDLMHSESTSNGVVELDPGHDDYYDTPYRDCPDLKDHPAWTTA